MDVEIIVKDPITRKCSLKTKSGKEFSLETKEHKLVLFQKDKEVGSIVMSSDYFGEIWKGEGTSTDRGAELIGEYDRRTGKYEVTPHKNHQLEIGKERVIHPLDYLIENLS